MKKATRVASATTAGVSIFFADDTHQRHFNTMQVKEYPSRTLNKEAADLYVGNKGYYSPYKSETRKAELQQQKQPVTPIKQGNIARLFTKVDNMLSL